MNNVNFNAELWYNNPPRVEGMPFYIDEGQSPEYYSAIKSIRKPPVRPLEGAKDCKKNMNI